jgi:hypothetical protein
VYEPPDPNVYVISDSILLEDPQATSRTVQNQIEMKTIAEANFGDPFPPKRKRRKKKKKNKKILGVAGMSGSRLFRKKPLTQGNAINLTDYVEYNAIDNNVDGMHFRMLLKPHINPDTIVSYNDKTYRVQSVNMYGSNYPGEWTTEIESDVYEPTSGDEISSLL